MAKRNVIPLGSRFGRWTVIANGAGRSWLCRCECGREHQIDGRSLRSGGTTRCRSCRSAMAHAARARPAAEEFFWPHVDKTNSCWLWTGATSKDGYGRFDAGSIRRAHRFSWALHFGPPPAGLMVCHHCDVRTCVNPDHLFLGTARDNAQDALAKGRLTGPVGPKPYTVVVPPDVALEIRSMFPSSKDAHKAAAHFGFSRKVCWDVIRRRSFRYLP